jgi:hypothetical protein
MGAFLLKISSVLFCFPAKKYYLCKIKLEIMAFNDELRHKLLFDKIKDIYEYFQGWEEYSPSICDDSVIEKLRDASHILEHRFDSIIQELDELQSINIDSFGC